MLVAEEAERILAILILLAMGNECVFVFDSKHLLIVVTIEPLP